MRLLILNWRDYWHPLAGGAELVTLRMAERLSAKGWTVEWFSALYPGASKDEVRHGIRFVRSGNQFTVHVLAYLRYRSYRNSFDQVLDEINTIPFYAHLYFKCPTHAYINQLAQEVWRYEKGVLIGTVGLLAERFYLMPYRTVPIITISKSSALTLRAFGMRGRIKIFDMAVDEDADETVPIKNPELDIAVVGRITPSKRVEHSIIAAGLLSSSGWAGRLIIVGGGKSQYVESLKRKAARMLPGRIIFRGRVDDDTRSEILRQASCLWVTSVREGWGLVVTEAARHGTPAVVYRVPGLVDSVQNGVTGYVVDETPSSLCLATLKLFRECHEKVSSAALEASRSLDWDQSAKQFEDAILCGI